MKKILITGGTGTVGSAFIKRYYNDYKFYSISRGEEKIAELNSKFPNVTTLIRDIENLDQIINTFESIKPDIVIHAAALKHVNLAETNPTKAIDINLRGSLNVINASIRAEVPLTIGISTDKACAPENVYGYSKKMMEQIFTEHHNSKTKFICTRFANVAGSRGSVIPFFKDLVSKNLPLKLTSKDMNRLIFSSKEAAKLIHSSINLSNHFKESFVLSKKMKSVNMLRLAKAMSDDIEIVGLRPGEKLNEALISNKELSYTKVIDDYILLFNSKQPQLTNLKSSFSSKNAPIMSDDEIINLIN
jgi:UDP-N-acetylglucosamine 4,6-dehydratase